jgi:hypothetical protein
MEAGGKEMFRIEENSSNTLDVTYESGFFKIRHKSLMGKLGVKWMKCDEMRFNVLSNLRVYVNTTMYMIGHNNRTCTRRNKQGIVFPNQTYIRIKGVMDVHKLTMSRFILARDKVEMSFPVSNAIWVIKSSRLI